MVCDLLDQFGLDFADDGLNQRLGQEFADFQKQTV